jgi:hypothetical protein
LIFYLFFKRRIRLWTGGPGPVQPRRIRAQLVVVGEIKPGLQLVLLIINWLLDTLPGAPLNPIPTGQITEIHFKGYF